MRPDPRKYLFDIQDAAQRLVDFTADKDFDAYLADDVLRSAVERQFTVIGEAVTQLARLDSETARYVTDHRRHSILEPLDSSLC